MIDSETRAEIASPGGNIGTKGPLLIFHNKEVYDSHRVCSNGDLIIRFKIWHCEM